ncbi:MAG: 2-C-methyl-D-erythritol 4-phosphate cytidylyltransferase [Oleiphilaceae bacterium]|jgi:2-C-methyl-D-erythritol 4-phosphate cytidylyltransferase/2-C-methyl-D-erythritol 2,4-cyclodiphosphate synthase
MSETFRSNFWVILPAAGIGSRMSVDRPKQYLKLADQTILEHTINCFLSHSAFQTVVLGLSKDDQYWAQLPLSNDSRIQVFMGGAERVDSVLNGLAFISDRAKPNDWVWVHDAARPCLSHADIDKLICALEANNDGALLAVPVHDTVKRVNERFNVETTVDRKGLWRAMTPQVFRFSQLKQALEQSLEDHVRVTDESSAIEYMGGAPFLVQGSDRNIKVTHPSDLKVAARTIQENIKKELTLPIRIGTGFDVHAFGDGNLIVLGGVKINYSRGLIAHSDGDVLLHAIIDALLGALALGDIGKHFPDTDEEWKGADSRKLLRAVMAIIMGKGYRVGNLDSTIIAQAPKMAPHIECMCRNIAEDLDVPVSDVSVKATTSERLGFTGRKEGIACQASIILVRI